MLIGYIRAKADDEDALLAQRQALLGAECQRCVEELVGAGQWDQPALRGLLDQVREGDVVVVWRLECLGRSLGDVVRSMQHIGAAGAGFRSLSEAVDTTLPEGWAVAQAVDSLAALDRGFARDRIGVGLAAARAEGRVGGRRPKLSERQRAGIADEVLSGRRTGASMARLHKISEATVSRVVEAYRTDAQGLGAPG